MINRKYHTRLNETNLVEVKNFALVWNIFEGCICNYHFTIENIEERLAGIDFNIEDFQEYISYFKNRYTQDGQMSDFFHYLHFRPRDRREFVERTLLEEHNSTRDYILTITIIIYRLRNNLFHGLKEMHSINTQRDNFRNANQFLIKLIDILEM